ncbi:MAG: RNase adapter RapZ [Bacillota bacterium]|nr:RNase adapter RapZ [Bacillota bacterium]
MHENTLSEKQRGASPANIIIITGMSGAGKTKAIDTLEDIGFFCIDNLPPYLMSKFISGVRLDILESPNLAIATDIRSGASALPELEQVLSQLREEGVEYCLVFLESSETALVRRYKENRRPHPLARGGKKSTIDCIRQERVLLEGLRGRADMIIDTTDVPSQQMGALLAERLGNAGAIGMSIYVSSFGFKYGLPMDSDMVVDVRFLPNPYYDPDLRELCGLDQPVRDYVLGSELTKEFLSHYMRLLRFLLPNYQREGKRSFTLSVGCTGGKHRSVALAEEISRRIRRYGYQVQVHHRDQDRWIKK